MMPEILCLTGCDEAFGALSDISLRSLRHYCQRHGFRLTFQPLESSGRPLSWSKIPLIQEAFRHGAEFVWWMDADTVVVDPSRSIRDVVEPGKDLYLVKHHDGQRATPNAGIMLLRNTPWMTAFLEKVWGMEAYIDHVWWENAALVHLLSRESFSDDGITDERDRVDDVPVKWLGIEWNSIPFVHQGRFASPDPVVTHYASIPTKIRLAAMRRDYWCSPAGMEELDDAPSWLQTWRWLRRGRIRRLTGG